MNMCKYLISKESITKQEQTIDFISISNGNFEVTFCSLGAAIFSIYFDNKLMTMTPKYKEDYLNGIYHGKIVGRSANRIKGNIVKINDKSYELKNNEGPNTLHGGIEGLSTKNFNYKVKEDDNKIALTFRYLSKNGESGFPGNLLVEITYEITDDEILCLFNAVSDEDTICNLTNHTYFTMGESSLKNCMFKVNASNYLYVDSDDLLPIKKETVFKELDFRNFKNVVEDVDSPKIMVGKANGYDHNFYLDHINSGNFEIFMKGTRYLLSIKTNFECCQIYSDNYTNKYEWIGLDKTIRRSLAIEPQDDFLVRKILKSKEKYYRYIIYKFTKLS